MLKSFFMTGFIAWTWQNPNLIDYLLMVTQTGIKLARVPENLTWPGWETCSTRLAFLSEPFLFSYKPSLYDMAHDETYILRQKCGEVGQQDISPYGRKDQKGEGGCRRQKRKYPMWREPGEVEKKMQHIVII